MVKVCEGCKHSVDGTPFTCTNPGETAFDMDGNCCGFSSNGMSWTSMAKREEDDDARIDSLARDEEAPPENKNLRAEILEAARKCICADRENQYGSPENSFSTIASFWNDYLSTVWNGMIFKLEPKDVAMMMALLKVARIANGRFKKDSFIDGAGYMAIAAELADNEA